MSALDCKYLCTSLNNYIFAQIHYKMTKTIAFVILYIKHDKDYNNLCVKAIVFAMLIKNYNSLCLFIK